MRRMWIMLAVIFLLSSCATAYNNVGGISNKGEMHVILPFENYTETSMAGLRASAILEGVMRANGYKVKERFWEHKDTDFSPVEIKELFARAKNTEARYVVTGQVNEWRYKTGIDGEPAVSITINIYDAKSGGIVWSGTAARSGWSYESLGTAAQKLMDGMFS